MAAKTCEEKQIEFCYISAMLHTVFFSGQCGFNMALLVMIAIDQPYPYIALTLWLVFEGMLITLLSTLLLYGMWKQLPACVLSWLIVVGLCISLYLIGTILELFDSDGPISYFAKLNTAFYFRRLDIIGIAWRIYLIVTMVFLSLFYKKMKKNPTEGNIPKSMQILTQ